MEIKRMRTINECLQLIKAADPCSALSYSLIKKMCDDSVVKYIKTGTRYVVNFDDLLAQLFG